MYGCIFPISTHPQIVGVSVPMHLHTAPRSENPLVVFLSNNAVKNITDIATFCANAEYMEASDAVSQ